MAVAGLPGANLADSIADKVIGVASPPFEVGPLVLTIGISVGVAYSEAGSGPWQDLPARADEQLLKAKAAGRGRRLGEAE